MTRARPARPRGAIVIAAGFGLVIALSSSPSVALEECIAPRRCDEGIRCEVLRQLSMWRQLRGLYKSKALTEQAYREADAELRKDSADPAPQAIEERAAQRLQQLVAQRANDGKTILLPACKSGMEDPPGYSVDSQCIIRANRTARNAAGKLESQDIPASEVEGIKACRELVEAAKSHEEHHRAECCKVSCQSGCTEGECDEVSRRRRCTDDPSRAECQTAYASRKGAPPPSPSRDTVADTIREERKGYEVAIKRVQNEIMAEQPGCSVADAKFKKAQDDLLRRAKLMKAKKGGGK